MNQTEKEQLVALKYSLENEVSSKHGQCRVEISNHPEAHSFVGEWLYCVTISTQDGTQQWEVFKQPNGEIGYDLFRYDGMRNFSFSV